MILEHVGLSQINGSLVVLDGVQNASYDEMVVMKLTDGTQRVGRIVMIEGEKCVIQVFEGTTGFSLDNTRTTLSGHPMMVDLSPEILGRTLDGLGRPIDGLGEIYPEFRRDVNGSPINPVISGRLEEMPADEGYPAYLPSRLAEFYERAGYVRALNGEEGSVTVIGAVSPPGADFSEPVTQNTKRFTRCFWALDKALAYARHYPAINWNTSYTEYLTDLAPWYYDNVGPDFLSCREQIASLLLQETSLMEIVKLIGSDVLPDDQKLVIEIARVIRVGFLQQNFFHDQDTYVSLEKQLKMMKVILHLYEKSQALVARQIPISKLLRLGLFDKLVKMKYDIPNDKLEMFDEYTAEIDQKIGELLRA